MDHRKDPLGKISPVQTHTRREPEERTLVCGMPVVRVSAWWMSANPFVWKCPDCANGFIAAPEKFQAVSAALHHREAIHS